MNCVRCTRRFDEAAHAPRILVACGHTLCERCVALLLKNERLECPECATESQGHSVDAFPKNLALLSSSMRKKHN